ncbi:MAG: imidazole glycerol phosphate synthase subunit HisH [Clostridia bacterium]|nr:imidazole glycerol phosphate synthase subunit HisH [Clostridia bacterium]
MIAIIDYGVGNLFSLTSSFGAIGAPIKVTSRVEDVLAADRIVLPGVGAFEDAINKLKETGLDKTIVEEVKKGKPILGICLGMQLFFDKDYENGCFDGLGLIKGEVRPISDVVPKTLKIPHMGWNELIFTKGQHPLFKNIKEGDSVYFVHSYHATNCDENIIAVSEYGADITAAVAKGNIMGCQFHPEKSGDVGLNILRAFCEM